MEHLRQSSLFLIDFVKIKCNNSTVLSFIRTFTVVDSNKYCWVEH